MRNKAYETRGSRREETAIGSSRNLRNIRLFSCSCHYKLRFGAKSCPYCFRVTPFYNRISFWVLAAVLVLLVAGLALGVDDLFFAGETQNLS